MSTEVGSDTGAAISNLGSWEGSKRGKREKGRRVWREEDGVGRKRKKGRVQM
jgi:hypothetical protein